MAEVFVVDTSETIVLHFDVNDRRINAYTLASTLVSLADAAKAANADLNPGFNVEIVVEALGAGSFRAQFRAIYSSIGNLFSKEAARTIILGVIASAIYERVLSPAPGFSILVHPDEAIISVGTDRVIIPRNVYDASRLAEKNPQFSNAINKSLDSVVSDEKISGMGFVSDMSSPDPSILLTSKLIRDTTLIAPDEISNTRIIEEQCELQIVKAILERSRRKWEFIWRGVRISAPVIDSVFYQEFFAHRIKIAPGDLLNVRLAIKQIRDPDIGIYTNVGYDVIEVFNHVPQMEQADLIKRLSRESDIK